MRTEVLKELKEQLTDLIAQFQDEIHLEIDMSPTEQTHWEEINHTLGQQMIELDYLFASMDAADEQDLYDEDGNLEEDDRDTDGTIWQG